ncbi:hypothetical protein CYCD_00990 [Tenuifilaceae bacterium CYCD]|nr:hypothetical protein CYCD_00990 [Tenuifilaceae bacterium CYCD]
MESNNDKLKAKKAAFEQSIKNGSDEYIISTLEEIRESGEEYMVEAIINLLFTKRSEHIKNEVVNFLVDIKNHEAATEITNAIRNNYASADLHRLVSVCWQSRLDFSSEIGLFIDILCKLDYKTGIEAFSVIENALDNTPSEDIAKHIAFLKSEASTATESKRALLQQMIAVMEEFGGGK